MRNIFENEAPDLSAEELEAIESSRKGRMFMDAPKAEEDTDDYEPGKPEGRW